MKMPQPVVVSTASWSVLCQEKIGICWSIVKFSCCQPSLNLYIPIVLDWLLWLGRWFQLWVSHWDIIGLFWRRSSEVLVNLTSTDLILRCSMLYPVGFEAWRTLVIQLPFGTEVVTWCLVSIDWVAVDGVLVPWLWQPVYCWSFGMFVESF